MDDNSSVYSKTKSAACKRGPPAYAEGSLFSGKDSLPDRDLARVRCFERLPSVDEQRDVVSAVLEDREIGRLRRHHIPAN